jgi:O-antigen/teichoic acid export membrane protein
VIKLFFKNTFVYTLGGALTRGVAILLLPIYTNYLSPAEYGIVDLFIIIASIANIIIALEISEGIGRYYQDAKDEKEKAEYTSSAFWFTCLAYLLFLSISLFFSNTLSFWLLGDFSKQNIFILAVFAIATNGIFFFTKSQLKWQIQAKDSVVTALLNVFVVTIVAVYLLVVEGLKLESIFIGQIAGNIISSFVCILYAKKSYRFTFCISKIKQMISYSMPLVFSGIGLFIAMYIDRIAIKDLLGLDELGIYSIAYRFAGVAFLVLAGFQKSLSPLVFKHYKEENTPSDISKIFDIFIIFALFVVSGAILFNKELVVLFTTDAYYSSASLIPILTMAVFFSNMYIFAPGIAIAKKTKLILIFTATSAILNIILNYILIPIFGLNAAAYATLISSISVFLIYTILSHRFYPIFYQVKKILLSSMLMLIVSYSLTSIFYEIKLISIIIKMICLLLVPICCSFFLLEKKYLQKIKLEISKKI